MALIRAKEEDFMKIHFEAKQNISVHTAKHISDTTLNHHTPMSCAQKANSRYCYCEPKGGMTAKRFTAKKNEILDKRACSEKAHHTNVNAQ